MIRDIEPPDFDKNDPEFRAPKVCRHRDGDPDCECHPEEDEDEPTQPPESDEPEAAEAVAIVETLPAVLTAAQVSERELRRLETYRGELLADVTDGKAAKNLDAKRREVKSARTTAARICKEQREEAIKIQKGWIAIEKGIADRLAPVESHLEAEAARHDAWKAEQARIAEAARLDKIRQRVEQAVAAGIPLSMADVETMDADAWDAHIAQATRSKAIRDQAEAIASELSALGDPCDIDEALALTIHQAEHRLAVARKADHDRREAERIKAEEEAEAQLLAAEAEQAERERVAAEERAARERLERGANRMRELALLGSSEELDILADMGDEAWSMALAVATQDKADRDRIAAQERQAQAVKDAELARLQQEAADRERIAAEALEQAEREAQAAALEAARIEAARLEAERIAAQRPEREKIAAWARATLDGIPAAPEIVDRDLLAMMSATATMIRDALQDIEDAMKD
jgi:hypothetical protein